MTMSVTELAALPTAPTVSKVLAEAARYADDGPYAALHRAVYGSTDYANFIAAVTPEHAITEGVALIAVASLINPEVRVAVHPNTTWSAGAFSNTVRHAHQVIGAWAGRHTAVQLAHLLEATADHVATQEAPHA